MTLSRRSEIEARERQVLAPYAALSCESRGRVYRQEEHPLRTAFQRDRDRIVHSSAFRRMEYKTQVFLPHEGDHLRTRLTHTMEVAQIARTLARSLRVNEDLTEAIALVHDVGHTPFGHSGEYVLDDLLAHNGGFNHNWQSLRVVDILEERYPEHPGLNLTYEVREGIVKHETSVVLSHPDFDSDPRPTLEASLVDIADEIAYNAHDIDDGVRAGLIGLEEVRRLQVFAGQHSPFDSGKSFEALSEDQRRHAVVRYLVNLQATEVLEETERRLMTMNITDLASVRQAPEKISDYSDRLEGPVEELKSFLMSKVYRHPNLVAMARRAEGIIRTLFDRFRKDTSLLPKRFQDMLETEEAEIVIADYIAGMTDRYAEQRYEYLK